MSGRGGAGAMRMAGAGAWRIGVAPVAKRNAAPPSPRRVRTMGRAPRKAAQDARRLPAGGGASPRPDRPARRRFFGLLRARGPMNALRGLDPRRPPRPGTAPALRLDPVFRRDLRDNLRQFQRRGAADAGMQAAPVSKIDRRSPAIIPRMRIFSADAASRGP